MTHSLHENHIKARILLALEIIVGIFLLTAGIVRMKNPQSVQFDLSACASEYMHFYDSENTWFVESGEVESEDPCSLLNTQEIGLKAGSYTIVVEYDSDNSLNCSVASVEWNHFVHANSFTLSRNKNRVTYDFYITRDIPDFKVLLGGYQSGKVELKSIEIYRSSHNERLILFTWVCLCILMDIIGLRWGHADRKVFLSIVAIALLASILCCMEGINLRDDGGFHLIRIEGIAQGLKAGQFPVRMNSVFDDGYGYPVGVFYGDALLYFPALLRIIGFSVSTAYKLYIVFINLLTTVNAYYCGKQIFRRKGIALAIACAYVLASYRLVDIWGRAAVGEYTALTFLPLIALAVWKIYTEDVHSKTYKKNALLLSAGILGGVYTHVLSTEMMVLVVLGIAVVGWKKTFRKETLLVYVRAVAFTALGGAAFLVPFVDYYLNTATEIKTSAATTQYIQYGGAYLSDYIAFFRSVMGGNSSVSAERMQLTPGLVLMGTLLAAGMMVITGHANKRIRILSIGAGIILLLGSNLFPWNALAASSKIGNMLAAIQFPWRYIGFALIFLALLLGEVIRQGGAVGLWQTRKACRVVMVGTVLTLSLFVSSFSTSCMSSRIYYDTAELMQYTGGRQGSVNGAEYLLTGTDIDSLNGDITTENGTAEIVRENGVDMDLACNLEENAAIEIPRFHYPYYTATDDNGNELELTTGTNNKIKVLVPTAYSGEIHICWKEPIYWRVAELVSLLTVVVMILSSARKNSIYLVRS